MSDLMPGIQTLVQRMETNPDEFFGDAGKWRFIFSPNFREVLTEPEKGALHEALKKVRRKEFDYSVMQTLLNEEAKERAQGMISHQGSLGTPYPMSGFGQAQIKQEGASVIADRLALGNFK